MNKFTPWKIENGTLQLLPWEHGAGDVLVTVDVFEAWEGLVLAESSLPAWRYAAHSRETRDIPLRPMEYSEVLSDLFAHIDANPQTTFHLVTAYPERVLECWRDIPIEGCDNCPDCGGLVDENGECPGWKGEDSEHARYRPNVTLSALIHTQEEADQRLPVLLELASLCREVYPMCRPVERIDLTHVDEFVEVVNQGSYSRVSDTLLGFQWTFPIPRIVVSGGEEPMHPDHVRDLRDQAAAAGVPFVFDGWGDWLHMMQFGCGEHDLRGVELRGPINAFMARVGSENSGCELDDKTYPWESEVANG